jgi:hypothetical protein
MDSGSPFDDFDAFLLFDDDDDGSSSGLVTLVVVDAVADVANTLDRPVGPVDGAGCKQSTDDHHRQWR